MLRRDPTRIELKSEDLADFERAREEYLESSAKSNTKDLKKFRAATTTGPPPTPAGRELRSTTASGAGNSSSSSGASKEPQPDPFEVAQHERKGKSTSERVLGE